MRKQKPLLEKVLHDMPAVVTLASLKYLPVLGAKLFPLNSSRKIILAGTMVYSCQNRVHKQFTHFQFYFVFHES